MGLTFANGGGVTPTTQSCAYFPGSSLYAGQENTVMAWVQLAAAPTTSAMILDFYSYTTAANRAWSLLVNSSRIINAYWVKTDGSSVVASAPSAISTNSLYHVAVTFGEQPAKALRLYINGVVVSTVETSVTLLGGYGQYLSIGSRYVDGASRYGLNGAVFDARIYSEQLGAETIANIHAMQFRDSVFGNMALRAGIVNGYVGNTPSAVHDHSSHKNHGSVYQSPTVAADPYSTVKSPILGA